MVRVRILCQSHPFPSFVGYIHHSVPSVKANGSAAFGTNHLRSYAGAAVRMMQSHERQWEQVRIILDYLTVLWVHSWKQQQVHNEIQKICVNTSIFFVLTKGKQALIHLQLATLNPILWSIVSVVLGKTQYSFMDRYVCHLVLGYKPH